MSEPLPSVFGTIAEFGERKQMIGAARQLQAHGYTEWDIYGPAPIDEIDALVPTRRAPIVTAIMVASGLVGLCVGYFIQYWTAAIDYPINVGGRPYNGWPGFIPSAWEIGALFTVCSGFFAFLLFCRLSRLHHPIFAAPGFERATQDRFFVCVEATDRLYQSDRLCSFFGRHEALRVSEIRQ